jgi:hypothetical protein
MYGFVERYCFSPEDDIQNVMSVALINLYVDGFTDPLDLTFSYFVPLSATIYQASLSDPLNFTDTYSIYMNNKFDAQLTYLYPISVL